MPQTEMKVTKAIRMLTGKPGTRTQHPVPSSTLSLKRNQCCVSPSVPQQGNLAWKAGEMRGGCLICRTLCLSTLCLHLVRHPDTTSFLAKPRSVGRLNYPMPQPPGPSLIVILESVRPGCLPRGCMNRGLFKVFGEDTKLSAYSEHTW